MAKERDNSLSLEKAAGIVREHGVNGFEDCLLQFGLITPKHRVARVRELYEQAWQGTNAFIKNKDDAEASPTQRMIGTLSGVWQMRADPELAYLAIFSFYLRYRLDSEPCGDLFGMGFVPTHQQEFDERLYQLCYDSRLLGEMSHEPHDFARRLTDLLKFSLAFWSAADRDGSSYLPIEELELKAMQMIHSND